ncbi:MAG: hypothetical protein L0191_09230 [Acidobacteria bacterium]|nr:hypothetical protein [Acidobacteriota bacterium]
MDALFDRQDYLAVLGRLTDEEAERLVEMVDSGVFLTDPPILEEHVFVEYADEETRLKHATERRRERNEANALIGGLLDIRPFQQLQKEVSMRAEQFWASVAKGLSIQERPTSQRELDYRRGFYRGAVWAVHRLPAQVEAARRRRAKQEEDEE